MTNGIVISASLRDLKTPGFCFRLFVIPTVQSDKKVLFILSSSVETLKSQQNTFSHVQNLYNFVINAEKGVFKKNTKICSTLEEK